MTHADASPSGLSGPAARPRAVEAARFALELALVVVIAVLAARAVWFVVYGASAFPLELASTDTRPPARGAEAADMSRLASAGLFSDRRFETQAEAAAVIDAPETLLNLVLHGVRRSLDPERSTAVIQAPRQGQRSLGVGAEIVDGVTLEAVYADRVIINRRGARESLFLREEAQAGGTGLIRSIGEPVPEPEPALDSPAAEGAAQLDAQALSQGLRLALARDGDRILGFRITPESRPEVLAALGLQAGDLVTTVNGRTLERPADVLDLLSGLDGAEQVRFTVLRSGEALSLEADLR